MTLRWICVAVLVGLLSPITGAGILLACEYIQHRAPVTPDFYVKYARQLVITFSVLSSLPAALVTAMALLILPTVRELGMSSRSLLPLSTAVGAVCGVLITGALTWVAPPDVWILGSALNGAVWGLLVALYGMQTLGTRAGSYQ